MDDIDFYLDRHSHPYHDQLSISSCYWCRVSRDVDAYLKKVMKSVGNLDPLFHVEQIVPYGSSAERTNIFRPDEVGPNKNNF